MNKIIDIKTINKKIDNNVEKFVLDIDSRYRGQLFTLASKILSKNKVKIVYGLDKTVDIAKKYHCNYIIN